jgi:hypothetical protein
VRIAQAVNPGKTLLEGALLKEEEDRHVWEYNPVYPSPSASINAKAIGQHADRLKGSLGNRKKTFTTSGQPFKERRSPWICLETLSGEAMTETLGNAIEEPAEAKDGAEANPAEVQVLPLL